MKRYVYVGNIKQLCLFWDFQAFATNCLWTLVSKMTLGSYSSSVGNEMFSLLKIGRKNLGDSVNNFGGTEVK